MRKEYEQELKKISIVSLILMVILYLAMALIVSALVYFFYIVLSTPTGSGSSVTETLGDFRFDLKELRGGLLNVEDKIILLLCMTTMAAFFEAFFFLAVRLMNCFRKQLLFTDTSVRLARASAWLYVVFLLFCLIYSSVLPILTPLPEINLAVDVNSFFILGLVWIFAWMLQVGKALQLDSELAI